MPPVVVRRSAVRAWLVALAGVPLVVIGLDVRYGRRISDFLRSRLFRPEDTQLYEPRDMIWAAVLILVGAALTLWGLRELILPTPVVKASPAGLALALGHPLRRPFTIPWEGIWDVGATRLTDEEETLPAFWVRVKEPQRLPTRPWGARWIGDNTVALFAQDWEEPPEEVAGKVVDYAVAWARDAGEGARE